YAPSDHYRKHTGALKPVEQAVVLDGNAKAYTLTPTWKKQANADFYEIEFEDNRYTYIQDSSLLFEYLKAETDYSFKIRAANQDGYSDWTGFSARTKANPLLYAIAGIEGTSTVEDQEGNEIAQLLDFDEGN